MAKKQTTIADAAKEGTEETVETEAVETEVIETEIVTEPGTDVAVATTQDVVTFDASNASDEEIMAYNLSLIEGEDGDDGEGEESFGVAEIRIVQKDEDKERLGKFFIPKQNDTIVEDMRCSLLFVFKSRVYFPKPFVAGQQPLCRSNDGLIPAGNIKDKDENVLKPLGSVCGPTSRTPGLCEYAKWKRDANKKAVPPPCAEVYNLVVLALDSGTPYVIQCKGTGVAPYKAFLTEIKKAGRELQIETGQKTLNAMFSFNLAIDPKMKITPSGSAYIPMFSDIERLSGQTMMASLTARGYLRQPENLEYLMHNADYGNDDDTGGAGDSADNTDGEDFN